jgi:hypothetical protein
MDCSNYWGRRPRKLTATRFAELGRSELGIMAIAGRKSVSEVSRYAA